MTEFIKGIQSGNIKPFGLIKDIFDPSLPVPEGNWIEVQRIQVENLRNGLYVINGALTYASGSTNKSNYFRMLANGDYSAEISVELKDNDDVLYLPFQQFLNVSTGKIDVTIEGQQQNGGGAASLEIFTAFLSYEKKLDEFTQFSEINPFINRD